MTPVAIIDADLSTTDLAPAKLGNRNWDVLTPDRADMTELTDDGLDVLRGRLAPARGAALGIILGGAIWIALLLLIVRHLIK